MVFLFQKNFFSVEIARVTRINQHTWMAYATSWTREKASNIWGFQWIPLSSHHNNNVLSAFTNSLHPLGLICFNLNSLSMIIYEFWCWKSKSLHIICKPFSGRTSGEHMVFIPCSILIRIKPNVPPHRSRLYTKNSTTTTTIFMQFSSVVFFGVSSHKMLLSFDVSKFSGSIATETKLHRIRF